MVISPLQAAIVSVWLTPTLVAQTPKIDSVVNAGSFDTRLSPGARAIVYGSNLGPIQQQFGGAPGLIITVNGVIAPIYDSASFGSSLQIPVELPAGPVDIVVQYQGSSSQPFRIQLNSFSPGIFQAAGANSVVAYGDHARDNSRLSSANPAAPGEVIRLSVTGLGPTTPIVPTGQSAPSAPPALTTVPAQLFFGGRQIPALFSGLNPQ